MKYGSVCSGIEAATSAWHSLGWEPVFFSEIEPFPSAVLAHHYPDVPNYGDMTKFKEWPDATIDVLVGGTPCQSFSVAGLRKGLDDPRGNLTLTFLAIAEHYKPQWVVWENVPGVVSDSTNALSNFLDGLEALGYIIDIEILDAQYHGVPQRRRRVFVCAQHLSDLLKQRTSTSALTIMQCLIEILHGICKEELSKFAKEPGSLEYAHLSKDGALKRMQLFGITTDANCNWEKLLQLLAEVCLNSEADAKKSGLSSGGMGVEDTLEELSKDSTPAVQFMNTVQLWRENLAESYEVMKSFITSTATKTITQKEIYICSQAVQTIARHIHHLSQSSLLCWSPGPSALIALKEFMSYARFADSDLFARLDGIYPWHHFHRQAKSTDHIVRSIRTSCFNQILSVSHSLSGHPAPSREKGQRVAPTVTNGPPFSRTGNERVECEAMVINYGIDEECNVSEDHYGPLLRGGQGGTRQAVAFAQNTRDEVRYINGDGSIAGALAAEAGMKQQTYIMAHGQANAEICSERRTALTCNHEAPIACYSLQGNMIGREHHNGPQGDGINEDVSFTLNRTDHHAVAFNTFGGNKRIDRPEGGFYVEEAETSKTLDSATGLNPTCSQGGTMVASMQVRRLTPVECERLQGFPDNHTRIPWRKKPAEDCPDGPRYKALGNSMAVPVMHWIGKRIQACNNIKDTTGSKQCS